MAESYFALGIKIIMEGLGSSMGFNLQSFCRVCPSRGGGGRTGCGFTPKLKIQKANRGSNKCKLHIVPSVIMFCIGLKPTFHEDVIVMTSLHPSLKPWELVTILLMAKIICVQAEKRNALSSQK